MKNITIATFLCAVLMASATVFAADETAPVKPTVTIDKVPNIAPGPDGMDEISGKVSGVKNPTECKVIIYAFADKWYVQPTRDEKKTEIEKDLTWASQTHGGFEYAALLVKSSYTPADTLKSLPKEGGDVLAITKQKPKKD